MRNRTARRSPPGDRERRAASEPSSAGDSPRGAGGSPAGAGDPPARLGGAPRGAGDRPSGAAHSASGARSVARKLALQALYRWQLNRGPWQDVVQEFAGAEDMARADRDYFGEVVRGVCGSHADLDADLAAWMDRPPEQLDPIEHAVLLIGAHELKAHPEVPYRVVISEAVSLAKRFGATDGHKFVNAVLDRASRALRPHEH